MDVDKHFLCTILSTRDHAFLRKMSDDIYNISIVFSNPWLPQELCRAARQSQQPSHSCLCTFREKVLLVSHSSSHFCNHLVTSIEQRNLASAHLSKSLLQKFTTRLGERQRLTVLNRKSNPFIHAHEVSHSNWGTWNVALHMVLRDFQHSSIT